MHQKITKKGKVRVYKPEVSLVNFNLSEPLKNDEMVTAFNPEFAPPEVIYRREGKVSRDKMDIFSMGAVLFSTVTGHSIYEVIQRI